MSSPTLSFDGTDDYVDCGNKSVFESNQISVSVWINPNQQTENFARVYEKANDGSLSEGYRMMSRKNGGGWLFMWVDDSGSSIRLPVPIITNEWNHYTWTHDGSVGRVYLNGELIGNKTHGFNPSSTKKLFLGSSSKTGNNYNGDMDDFRIVNTTLTHSGIRNVMDGQVIGSEVVHYPMNEGSGSTLTDATTNNNPGTINGASWSSRSGGNTYQWRGYDIFIQRQNSDDINTAFKNDKEYIKIGQPRSHLVGGPDEAFYQFAASSSDSNLVDSSDANNDSLYVSPDIVFFGTGNKFYGQYIFSGNVYVKLPDNIQSNSNIIGTEMWVKPTDNPSNDQMLLDSNRFYKLLFNDYGNRKIRVGLYGDDNTFSTTLNPDSWNHINFYWDIGNEIGLSVNGSNFSTYPTTETVDDDSNVMYMGSSHNLNKYFTGNFSLTRFVTGQKIEIEESLYQNDGSLTTARKGP